jgi:exocyst complex protein 7
MRMTRSLYCPSTLVRIPAFCSEPGGSSADPPIPEIKTADVFSTLSTALDSRSRNLRGRNGTSAIFLLNNLSFLRQSILASSIVDVLGEGLEDTLNKRMRSAKASYLDVWSPLVSALLDAGFAEQTGAAGAIKAGIGAVKGTGGTERRETKDRFVRFHEALEEVEALHVHARIDENDLELRERLRSEVERMVVPTYAKFVQKHRKDNCTSLALSRLLPLLRAYMLIAWSRSDRLEQVCPTGCGRT